MATVRDALSVIGELESYDSDALVRSFEGWLSEPVQTAILSELGQGTPGRTPTPDAERVRAFTNTEEGEILARHWRSKTERYVSRVLYRLQNIRDNLSPQGNRQLDDWINKLNERQMVAAMIALVGDDARRGRPRMRLVMPGSAFSASRSWRDSWMSLRERPRFSTFPSGTLILRSPP